MSVETVAVVSTRVDPRDRHRVHSSVHDLLEARARASATGLCPRCEAAVRVDCDLGVMQHEHRCPVGDDLLGGRIRRLSERGVRFVDEVASYDVAANEFQRRFGGLA